MNLIEEHGGLRVHTRNISIATYACEEDDGIVVEGVLKDDRHTHHYTFGREKLPPDTVHHMVIRMRISGTTLIIQDIEVEMPGFPHADCKEMETSLSGLAGIEIAPGFTSQIKKTVGGVKGCVHLTALLLAMAPAAVQGFWSNRARNPSEEDIPDTVLEKFLIDTCWVWRREGPVAAKLLNRKAT